MLVVVLCLSVFLCLFVFRRSNLTFAEWLAAAGLGMLQSGGSSGSHPGGGAAVGASTAIERGKYRRTNTDEHEVGDEEGANEEGGAIVVADAAFEKRCVDSSSSSSIEMTNLSSTSPQVVSL